MSAEAPGAAREGLCELPVVPGAPNLVTDAMLAIMSAAGPADVEKLRQEWLRRGVEEGDKEELDMATLTRLLEDDGVADDVIATLAPDWSALCVEFGLPSAPFLVCRCNKDASVHALLAAHRTVRLERGYGRPLRVGLGLSTSSAPSRSAPKTTRRTTAAASLPLSTPHGPRAAVAFSFPPPQCMASRALVPGASAIVGVPCGACVAGPVRSGAGRVHAGRDRAGRSGPESLRIEAFPSVFTYAVRCA
jgi:hypothetical protein